MTLDSERARELAAKSAESRARRRRWPDSMPPLDSPANAKKRLEIISDLGMIGKLTAAQVGAQERIHREWRETYFAELDLRRLKLLDQRVKELEAELARRAGAGVRRLR